MKLCNNIDCSIRDEELCNRNIVNIFVKSNPSITKFLWNISLETILTCPERFHPFPTYFIKNKNKNHYKRGNISNITKKYIPDEDFENVKSALKESGLEYEEAEVTMVPQSNVKIDGKEAERMIRLMEALEDCDDVQNVYANFDISEELLEALG